MINFSERGVVSSRQINKDVPLDVGADKKCEIPAEMPLCPIYHV